MTRKDFQLIADVPHGADVPQTCRVRLAADFAARLADTNPRFDRARFVKACGA